MIKKILLSFVVLLICTSSVCSAYVPWTGLSDTSTFNTGKKYFLHTGFIFEAVLSTSIFSFNLESPVIAMIEFDVIYLGKIMVPKDSKIIGYASVVKSGDRVNVFFHTIVFPDGSEIKFSGLGLHTDGSAGIPGKVKKHAEKVPARVLLGAAGTLALRGGGPAGEIAKGLSQEAIKEVERYTPDYSVTVKKDAPIKIYNIQRAEY